MYNTTNVNHALFTKRNETRFVDAFERLVDHITKTPMDERTASWLESTMYAAIGQQPAHPDKPTLESLNTLVARLRKQLAEANAKLANRF